MAMNNTPARHSRRQILGYLGAACISGGLAHSGRVSAATPGCVVRPEQTEGPYFADRVLNRSDIRSDPGNGKAKPGVPLELTLRVSGLVAGGCKALDNARVDLWQCDAGGRYSDVQGPGFNSVGEKYLRGYQLTNAAGEASFLTIYPGWYPGRTVHIHFKIRTGPGPRGGHEYTSQLYFNDSLTDAVLESAPYAGRAGQRVHNRQDGLFRRGGEQLMLEPEPAGNGYRATFDIALLLS